jgi:hypothetical protein
MMPTVERAQHEDAMDSARAAFSPHCEKGSSRDKQIRAALRAYLVQLGESGSIDAQAILAHYVDAR